MAPSVADCPVARCCAGVQAHPVSGEALRARAQGAALRTAADWRLRFPPRQTFVGSLCLFIFWRQVPEPHPDIGDFWTLYDYGLDTVKTWPVKCVCRARSPLQNW